MVSVQRGFGPVYGGVPGGRCHPGAATYNRQAFVPTHHPAMKRLPTPTLAAISAIVSMAASAMLFTAPARAADVQGDATAGSKKVAMCIGCHSIPGYQSSFPEVYHVPMIAGQNPKYIVDALTAYKKGERHHPTMRGIA